MEPTIIAAICSAVAVIVGAFLGYLASKHQTDVEANSIEEQNKLLVFKVDTLIADVKELNDKLDNYKKEIVDLALKVSALESEHRALEKRVSELEHFG